MNPFAPSALPLSNGSMTVLVGYLVIKNPPWDIQGGGTKPPYISGNYAGMSSYTVKGL